MARAHRSVQSCANTTPRWLADGNHRDSKEIDLSFPLDLGEAVWVFALVAFASSIQASLGFGLGLISAPLLFLICPALIPGPLMASALVLTLLIAYRERKAIDIRGVGFALTGRIFGTLAALLVWTEIAAEAFDVLFAGLVLLAVALSISGLRVSPSPASATGAGALSGFMGTLSSIGGPPMALLYQRESGPRLRGTLSGFFVVGALLSLVGLAAIGRYRTTEILLSIQLLPAVYVGYLTSRWIQAAVDRTGARPFILGLSFLSALAVLYRAIE